MLSSFMEKQYRSIHERYCFYVFLKDANAPYHMKLIFFLFIKQASTELLGINLLS